MKSKYHEEGMCVKAKRQPENDLANFGEGTWPFLEIKSWWPNKKTKNKKK